MTTVSRTYFYIVILAALILIGLAAQFYASQADLKVSENTESVISIQKIHADTPELVASFYQGEPSSENELIKHQNLLELETRKLNEQVGLYQESLNSNQKANAEQLAITEIGNNWITLSKLISSLLDVSSELTTQNKLKVQLSKTLNEMQASVDDVAKALERESRIDSKVSKVIGYVELVAKVSDIKNNIANMVEAKNNIGTLAQTPRVISDQLDTNLASLDSTLRDLKSGSDLLVKTKLVNVQRQYSVLADAVNTWQKSLDTLSNAHVVKETVDQRSLDFKNQLISFRQAQASKNDQRWINWLGYLLPLLAALLLLFRGKNQLQQVTTFSAIGEETPLTNLVSSPEIVDEDETSSDADKLNDAGLYEEDLAEDGLGEAGEIEKYEARILKLESSLVQSEAEKQEIALDLADANTRKFNLESDFAKQQKEIDKRSEDLAKLQQEIDDKLSSIQQKESDFTIQFDNQTKLQTEIEQLKSTRDELLEKSESMEATNKELQQELDGKLSAIRQQESDFTSQFDNQKKLRTEIEQLKNARDELLEKSESMEATNKELQQEVNFLNSEIAEERLSLEQEQATFNEKNETFIRAKQDLAATELQLDELEKVFERYKLDSTSNQDIDDYVAQMQAVEAGDYKLATSTETASLTGVANLINALTNQLDKKAMGVNIASEDIDEFKMQLDGFLGDPSESSESTVKHLNQSILKLEKLNEGVNFASTIFEKTSAASGATIDIVSKTNKMVDAGQLKVKKVDARLANMQQGISVMAEPLESLVDKTLHIKEVVSLIESLSDKAVKELSEPSDPQVLARRSKEMADSFHLAAIKMSDAIDHIHKDTDSIAVSLNDNLSSLSKTYIVSQGLEDNLTIFSKGNKQILRLHTALKKRFDNQQELVEDLQKNITAIMDHVDAATITLKLNNADDSNDSDQREALLTQLDNLKNTLNSLK